MKKKILIIILLLIICYMPIMLSTSTKINSDYIWKVFDKEKI